MTYENIVLRTRRMPGDGLERTSRKRRETTEMTTVAASHPTYRSPSFINPFIAFATAKLDLAMICLDSFVTSGSACTSWSFLACSESCSKISAPCREVAGGRLPLQTATMLDTIVMICVRFSFRVGAGIGVRTPESTLWMAYTIDSVWASR